MKHDLVNAIKSEMKAQNLSVSAFAEMLGTGRYAVRRILDPNNTSISLNTISRAAHSLGFKITLQPRKLTTNELVELADKLTKAPTTEEADDLEHRFMEGFYGKPYPHVKNKT